MTLQLIYFAALRDLLNITEETIDWAEEGWTVNELVSSLQEKHPNLSMEGVRVALNEEFVKNDAGLSDGDVVAFIPPVSGG